MPTVQSEPVTLAVCLPVWNRPDLFKVCFDSLIRNLTGLDASIWIFDNGSDAPTSNLIASLVTHDFRLFKIGLPQNMGIPYVANIFSQMVSQDCDYVGFRSPTHILLADADVYFKRPVSELLEILAQHRDAGIISGHDSPEHEALREYFFSLSDGSTLIKEKKIERGTCLLARREVFSGCVPFPHDAPFNVDWQLMTVNVNSMAARNLKVLAVDHVVHLGVYDSTWCQTAIPADEADLHEVNRILEQEGLLMADRKRKMESYGGLISGLN